MAALAVAPLGIDVVGEIAQFAQFGEGRVMAGMMQLRWDNWSEMCDFAGVGPDREKQPHGVFVGPSNELGLLIPRKHADVVATQGQWIKKDEDGRLFVVIVET